MTDTEFQLQSEISTRALGKLTSVYYKRVRAHSPMERQGIIRQLQRLIKNGIGLEEMQVALENYIAYCTRLVCREHPDIEHGKNATVCRLCKEPLEENVDPRYRKNVRSFFSLQNVKLWQKPLPQKNRKAQRDPELDVFDRFDAARGIDVNE